MQALAVLLIAAHAVATPIVAYPPVPDGYGSVVASPVAIGAAELVGGPFILWPWNLIPDGQPGVVEAMTGGSAALQWASPVNDAAVYLAGFGDYNGELKLQGWLAGQLVGEVARPALFPGRMLHEFDADPAWVIDRLTWDGGGSVVAVQYQVVPEPSTLAILAIGSISGCFLAYRRKSHGRNTLRIRSARAPNYFVT